MLLVLLPSSVRCAKPKATGTAQKGIPGFFVSVVKAQQTADDDDDEPATARIILQKKEPDRTAVSGLRRGTTETIAIAKFILGGNIYPHAYS